MMMLGMNHTQEMMMIVFPKDLQLSGAQIPNKNMNVIVVVGHTILIVIFLLAFAQRMTKPKRTCGSHAPRVELRLMDDTLFAKRPQQAASQCLWIGPANLAFMMRVP